MTAEKEDSATPASPANITELNAARWLFTMEQQEAQGEKPQAFMAMFRKVRDENRSTPTRAEYEAATDAAMIETGFVPASAQPDTVTMTRQQLSDFRARTIAETVEKFSTAAPEPVSQPVVAVPEGWREYLEEIAQSGKYMNGSYWIPRAVALLAATPLAAPVEQDKPTASGTASHKPKNDLE